MIKGEQTKNKVIETAGDLFWKNGYANTGISDILKAADIPKGSFYFHFKKKSDVAEAVIQYYAHQTLDVLRTAAAQSTGWNLFCDSFLAAFQQKLKDKSCYGCPLAVLGMELAFQDPTLAGEYSNAIANLKDIFAEVLEKEGIFGERQQKLAELSTAIYEGNLLLHRISKEQSWMEKMNQQLKAILSLP